MAALICPECKEEKLVQKTGEYETTYVDRNDQSHPLKVPGVTWLECVNCGETILDDRAMSAIESARRAVMGLLTPGEVRGFRTGLQKTQKAMSELLGIGEKTYCRWESNSYVQSEAFDRYLRLLIVERANVDLLEQIADDKAGLVSRETVEDLEKTFVYLKDIRSVAEHSRPFIDQLVEGSLQAA
jgi:putative zinc finger/helix-turn-helix YgiT family protein